MPQTSFNNIRVAEEMGVADRDGYHLHFDMNAAIHQVSQNDGDHFSMWLIGDQRVAVFLYADKSKRAAIAAAKPASIDAAVFVDVVDKNAPTIDADTASTEKAPVICALAAAVGAYSAGELASESRRCSVRMGGVTHDVVLELDPDPNVDVWKGTVTSP